MEDFAGLPSAPHLHSLTFLSCDFLQSIDLSFFDSLPHMPSLRQLHFDWEWWNAACRPPLKELLPHVKLVLV